jgi:hypothetical protein
MPVLVDLVALAEDLNKSADARKLTLGGVDCLVKVGEPFVSS